MPRTFVCLRLVHPIILLFGFAAGAGAGCAASQPPEGGGPPDAGSGGAGTAGASATGGATGSGGAAANDDASTIPPVDAAVDHGATEASDAAPPDTATVDTPTDRPPGKVTHRVLSSVSDKGMMAIVGADGQIEWQYDALSLGGEANDAWMLANGDIVFAYKSGARQMTQAKQVVWNYNAPAGTEVHSSQPLPDGNTLIGEAHDGGLGLLHEIDQTGKVISTVTINVGGGIAPHNQFREVRKTPQGTYLVTYLQTNKAMEFDGDGKMLRQFPCGSFVAVRLPDGNTLISCGDAHSVIEVDPQNKVVWQVNETDVPGNRLGFAAGLQRLPNGNTVICNWPGHFAMDPHQPQAFELSPDKKVVWELNNAQLGWVSNLEVLDPDAVVGGVVLR
ncbi:MAG TPA: hypothetical protein VH374_02005 [Polyangia bacterium]|jgi:hypothetical protein|nr:hypothetical protein [Polyangia bacterium]